jgi:hypothetical protein
MVEDTPKLQVGDTIRLRRLMAYDGREYEVITRLEYLVSL